MTRLVSAIPVVAEQTGRAVVLVGGLAVMCRLPAPYRVTTDLDTVDRRSADQHSQLELLVSAGATPSGPSGALVHTPFGDVQVDVLQVTDVDLDALPDDPTDRLHVQSHAWAASTATGLTLSVKELPPLQVAVAEPGPIIAMKLQSIMNRGAAKEGTDLLDIVRITLDRSCGPTSWAQLRAADQGLRADALLHARRWFHEAGDRSLKKIRAVPEGRDLDLDDVRLVGDLLVAALTAGESAPVESDDVEQ
jgi:nucleotidyltransferase AbiEii toxin of type IV toxin-antitoxin system